MNRIPVLLIAAFMWSWSGLASAIQVPGPLVETDWLAAHQADVVILDVDISRGRSWLATRMFVTSARSTASWLRASFPCRPISRSSCSSQG